MTKRKGPTKPKPWRAMAFSHYSIDSDGRLIEVWGNQTYTAIVTPWPDDPDVNPLGVTELSIHTHTRSTRHDWRELQRVKNDIFGPEREAIELYPAESRVVDTANEYHLWVLPEGLKVPCGWTNRTVFDDTMVTPELQTRIDQAARDMGLSPSQLRKSKQRRL